MKYRILASHVRSINDAYAALCSSFLELAEYDECDDYPTRELFESYYKLYLQEIQRKERANSLEQILRGQDG